jgi:hypothetical protein
LSNSESGCVINDPEAKQLIDERYGPVSLPTIQEIVDKIFQVAEGAGGLHNVRFWKEDIVGAFNQFNFSPDSAKWLAFKIEDNVVLILFTGMFGWQGSPAVWATFSRALLRCASRRSKGLVVVYVDDFIGISVAGSASADQRALQELVFGVFGSDAINLDKSVNPCSKCDCIGWSIDLILGLLHPNDKGIKKLVAAFFGIDLQAAISQKNWQRLASLAERYSAGISGARAFVRPLHVAASRPHPHHASRGCLESHCSYVAFQSVVFSGATFVGRLPIRVTQIHRCHRCGSPWFGHRHLQPGLFRSSPRQFPLAFRR